MRAVDQFVHAYRITPWRLQRQWIGNFLGFLVAMAMVAALYLDVTARAAIAGREIQDLTSTLTSGRHAIADLGTQLAVETSAGVMQQRAVQLGFVPMKPADVEYVLVPGYSAPQPEILAATSQPEFRAPRIAPEYTQSLLDWLDQALMTLRTGTRVS